MASLEADYWQLVNCMSLALNMRVDEADQLLQAYRGKPDVPVPDAQSAARVVEYLVDELSLQLETIRVPVCLTPSSDGCRLVHRLCMCSTLHGHALECLCGLQVPAAIM